MTRLARHLANAARWLSRWFSAIATKLDPPATGDVDKLLETMTHAREGRIRRRRGESVQQFAARLVRGDFVLNENVIDFNQARARLAQKPAKPRQAQS